MHFNYCICLLCAEYLVSVLGERSEIRSNSRFVFQRVVVLQSAQYHLKHTARQRTRCSVVMTKMNLDWSRNVDYFSTVQDFVAGNGELTRTTFHSSNKTFFMGKCGAEPLQNLVTIPNRVTLRHSSPTIGIAAQKSKGNLTVALENYIDF